MTGPLAEFTTIVPLPTCSTSPYRCVCGGCLPRCASSSRIAKTSGRFMCSAMTVARPVGVIEPYRTAASHACLSAANMNASHREIFGG